MSLLAGGIVAVGILAWGHYALERNVNQMAQQLQDQVNAATQRIAQLENDVAELERTRGRA